MVNGALGRNKEKSTTNYHSPSSMEKLPPTALILPPGKTQRENKLKQLVKS
jgi:hypothetical protein